MSSCRRTESPRSGTPSAMPSSRRPCTASCCRANAPGSTPRSRGRWPMRRSPSRRIPGGRARLPLAGRARPAARVRRVDRGRHRGRGDLCLRRGAEDFEHALELWDQVPDAAARAPLDRVELLTRAAFHAEGPAPPAPWPTSGGDRAGRPDDRPDPSRPALRAAGPIQLDDPGRRDRPCRLPRRPSGWCPPNRPRRPARGSSPASGGALPMTDRPAEAVALCEEALAVARAAGAREVESRALVPLGMSPGAAG